MADGFLTPSTTWEAPKWVYLEAIKVKRRPLGKLITACMVTLAKVRPAYALILKKDPPKLYNLQAPEHHFLPWR